MGQYYKIIILADNKYTKEVIRAWMCPQSCNCGAKLMEHSYKKSKIVQVLEYLISPIGMFYKSRIVWAGDYAPPEKNEEENLYQITENKENLELSIEPSTNNTFRYVVNHSKQLYVDKEKTSRTHPLPLLVAEGNGQGGGDYEGNDEELCGTWSRDIISVEETIPENFEEFICNFGK